MNTIKFICPFSYPSTNQAQACLAFKIRQDWMHSGWYGYRLFIHSICDEG